MKLRGPEVMWMLLILKMLKGRKTLLHYFFDFHRHWVKWIIGFVAGHGDYFIHHIHSFCHFAEGGVGSVKAGGIFHANEEL